MQHHVFRHSVHSIHRYFLCCTLCCMNPIKVFFATWQWSDCRGYSVSLNEAAKCSIRSKTISTCHIVQSCFLGEFRFRVINGVLLHTVEDLYIQPASSQLQGNNIILTTTKGGNCDALQLEGHPTSSQSFSALITIYEAHNAPEQTYEILTQLYRGGMKSPKWSRLYVTPVSKWNNLSKLCLNSGSADNSPISRPNLLWFGPLFFEKHCHIRGPGEKMGQTKCI